MRPENVQVSFPDSRNKKSQNYTISWNGTWPSSTVFVVVAKKQTKSSSSESHDNSHDWTEIKQASSCKKETRYLCKSKLFEVCY